MRGYSAMAAGKGEGKARAIRNNNNIINDDDTIIVFKSRRLG